MKKLKIIIISTVISIFIIYTALLCITISTSNFETALIEYQSPDCRKLIFRPVIPLNMRLKMNKVDPNGMGEYGMPYFHLVLAGHEKHNSIEKNRRVLKIAKQFIDKGVNINIVDKRMGFTAIHNAILSRDIELIKFLIDNNIDLKARVGMNKSGKKGEIFGLSSIEFAEFILKKGKIPEFKKDYEEIIVLLKNHLTRRSSGSESAPFQGPDSSR